MIKEVNPKEILNFILKYFPNYKISSDPFEKVYAYFDYDIIGFISFSSIYERCEINYIAVDEKYRRRGIAQKLLDFCFNSNDFDNLKYHDPRCRELYKYTENGTTEVIGSENGQHFIGYSIVDFDQTFRAWKHKDSANNDVEDTFYYYNQNARGDYGCVISKENVTIDYDDIISGVDNSSVNGNGIVYKTSGCNARTAYIRGLSRRKQALYTARNPEYARVQTTRFQ